MNVVTVLLALIQPIGKGQILCVHEVKFFEGFLKSPFPCPVASVAKWLTSLTMNHLSISIVAVSLNQAPGNM